jgi:hypothetical protein
MPKKSRKEKNRNKRQSMPSIQTQEKVAQKPYTIPATSAKTTSPKSSTTTKTMPDYKYVYTEIKRIALLFVIITSAIVILWLIMR